MKVPRSRILVAEDNAALSRVVQYNLQQHGFEVFVAANGRVAFERASQEQFDAVVTDQQMPEMTGVELCRKLRELPNYQQVPIIMLTAKGLELEMPRLQAELGISAIYSKPFSPTKVVEAVQELLSSSPYST